MGSLTWDLSLGLEIFAGEMSLKDFRFVTFAWARQTLTLSLGNFRLCIVALDCRSTAVVWKRSVDLFRLGYIV